MKKILIVGMVVTLLLCLTISPALGWWNTSWNYREPIQINNTANANNLTDYQVFMNISYNSNMNNNFSDLRIINETANESLPYWIENKTNGSWAKVWFNATHIPASSWLNDTYYIYYGNPDAVSESDGNATFEFFDDFKGTSLDTSRWTEHVDTEFTTSVSDSYYNHTLSSDSSVVVHTNASHDISLPGDFAVRYKEAWDNKETSDHQFASGVSYVPGEYPTFVTWLVDWSLSRTTTWYRADFNGIVYNDVDAPALSGEEIFEMTRSDGTCKMWHDGELLYTGSDTTSVTAIHIFSQSDDMNDGVQPWSKFDWILVREYTSPEPTITIGAEEVDVADTTFTVSFPGGHSKRVFQGKVHFDATKRPAYENYTEYTETDPNSHLTRGYHSLEIRARNDEDCYLYKDFGVDYFGNFTHKVDIKFTGDNSTDLGYRGFGEVLANSVDDWCGLEDNNETAIGVEISYEDTDLRSIKLHELHNGTDYSDSYYIDSGAWYYLTITKSGTSLTCDIYNDSARTDASLENTLSLTLQKDHKFRYLYGANNYNTNSTAYGVFDFKYHIIDDTKIRAISTQSNLAPDGQYVTTPMLVITNTGNVNLTINININETVNDIFLKADNEYNPEEATEINTTYNTLCSELEPDDSTDIWFWSDFNHTAPGELNREMEVNVT